MLVCSGLKSMADSIPSGHSKVIAQKENSIMRVVLNRPAVINSLDLEMIRAIQKALDLAERTKQIRLVLLLGTGQKGFCAGGDIKAIAQALNHTDTREQVGFFEEEYALDLRIHGFPKPVIVIADGITMGGGLGLAAGADIVVATERTRMAMPETRIGFFPDVGATGWMFTKCPAGYPEFLGLTGYEMVGGECVRLGLASLSRCTLQTELCNGVFDRLSERSPTALVLTLHLLRRNEGRSLDAVFRAEAGAVRFILNHPDYFEGVRARLLDRDDNPHWQPDTVADVGPIELEV